MAEGAALLLVEAPGEARDALSQAAQDKGATVHTRDDAMQALAEIGDLRPQVVLVGADPGPPGAMSLCRILERKLAGATIYRLGDPSERVVLESSARCLPAALSATEVVERIFPQDQEVTEQALSQSEVVLAPLQFGAVMLRAADHAFSGRLWITADGGQWEVEFLHGAAVASRSDVGAERLGRLAVEMQMVDAGTVERGLDHARAKGTRMGEALLALGALDGHQLHRLLSEQHARRLSTLCTLGASRLRVVESRGEVPQESLLRVAPMTALARALVAVPKDEREALLKPVLKQRFTEARSSRETDAFLAQLGISDLSALIPHTRTLLSLSELITPTVDAEQGLSPSDVLLLLLWSGRLQVQKEGEGESSTGRLASILSQPELPQLPHFAGAEAPTLPAAVRDYLAPSSGSARAQRVAVLAGPAAEGSEALAGLLARYHVDGVQRSPLRVLGLDQVRSATEVRRAYLRAVSVLDELPDARPGDALAARRAELRLRYEQAYAALTSTDEANPVEDGEALAELEVLEASEPPPPPPPKEAKRRGPPPPVPSDEGTISTEMELLIQHNRWADLVALLEQASTPLAKQPHAVRLLYAVAQREAVAGDSQVAGAMSPEQIAIDALAGLLHTPPTSTAPVLLAKRILRKRRPIEWHEPATGRLSILVAACALIAGAAVGLLIQHSGLLHGLFSISR